MHGKHHLSESKPANELISIPIRDSEFGCHLLMHHPYSPHPHSPQRYKYQYKILLMEGTINFIFYRFTMETRFKRFRDRSLGVVRGYFISPDSPFLLFYITR